MKIARLVPLPPCREIFRRNRERFIPAATGCYALATFEGDVLYVGLSINLRKRMNDHLGNPQKTGLSSKGRATFFYWIASGDLNLIERSWLNLHVQDEGGYPVLNRIFSPIFI